MRSRLTRLQNALDELEHRRMEAEQPERELRATGHVQVGGVWFRPEDFLPAAARAELSDMAMRIHELVKTGDGTLANEGAEAELAAIMRRWGDLRAQGIAEAQRRIGTMRQVRATDPPLPPLGSSPIDRTARSAVPGDVKEAEWTT